MSACGLPVRLREPVDPGAMVEAMGMDKKTIDGQIRFILAASIGHVDIVSDYNETHLYETLEEFCAGTLS